MRDNERQWNCVKGNERYRESMGRERKLMRDNEGWEIEMREEMFDERDNRRGKS